MPEIDLSPLNEILPLYAAQGRAGLLPALHAAQRLYGWLPSVVAAQVARQLKLPLADVHGVIEFYSLFYNAPVGKRILRICTDAVCSLKGGHEILERRSAQCGVRPGETTADGGSTLEAAACLGLCEHAPAALINEEAETDIDPAANSWRPRRPESLVYSQSPVLTALTGKGRAATLLEYGAYLAFKKAVEMGPAALIAEIKASGLVGRGGAAFPTGLKWEGAAQAAGSPKYVVCNADESEPGTFKDRVLLLDDPHRMLEGLLIAGYATGAWRGYIYLRGEYPYILPVLENALSELRQAGLLGENILNSGYSFEIEVRLGAGAYICGEETALFESIEGKRGFPRIKPPFPTTHGLFGQPTVINNVETLCNVPTILSRGAAGYRQLGTEKSPGSKLFCLSGDVARPGVYEVPFGVSLRELLAQAGTSPETIQAVLFGGAAGAFARPDQLDVRLTFEDLRAAGLPLGSGVVMVFNQSRDLRQSLARLAKFFAHESCGKCYPCQMGTQRQSEILNRLAAGQWVEGDAARLQDLGWTMTDASLCGLGQTAASAVLSAMQQFPGLFANS